jgi:hypothetical protein
LNLEETSIKKTYTFEDSERAREVIKTVSGKLDYRYQEMNSIAAAYDGPKEAIIKNEEKLEAYREKAQEKIEEIKQD